MNPNYKYPFPRIFSHSGTYHVTINGIAQDVLSATGADVVIAPFSGPTEIIVTSGKSITPNPQGGSAIPAIRPLKRGIEPIIEEDRLRFFIDKPGSYHVDLSRHEPLYLFVHEPDEETPDPSDPAVHYFKGGQVHEVGMLELKDNQTVYMEAGSVVRGALRADGVKNVTIAGHGILDNSYFNRDDERCHPIEIIDSSGIIIRDITMIEPTRWTCVLRNCEQIEISNLHQITVGGGRDGIDLVSCRHAHVHDCFIRAGDDCIVIKAHAGSMKQPGNGKDSYDILVERCSLLNDGGGNGLEIGHELRTDSVRDITFRDCDIIHSHGMGAAISINNAAQAVVEDILFEDIRIEHFYDNLLWIRVMKSRYSGTDVRGQIRNVTFRNIAVHESIYNIGYSISVIGGYDPNHTVEGVRFENFTINNRKILSLHDFDCYVRDVEDISFR